MEDNKEKEDAGMFSKTVITIMPLMNGWIVKEGPKHWAFLDQESMIKHLIGSTTNQRKVYAAFQELKSQQNKAAREKVI